MKLSVIIVNYNVKCFLESCLLSVIKACTGIEAEILVVDNNSTDGSKQFFSNKFRTVSFFWLPDNVGFGKANNYALPFAKGDYILFLNPDTIVTEDCFINCLQFFEQHNNCGAVGVRMIDGGGLFLKESKRSFPTPSAGFYKMIGLAELFPASTMFAKYYAGNIGEKQNAAVDILAGAFMMLSKTAIDITNGFDESFFMYGEDIDLSYRIQKAGLQNYYLGENTIIHFKGESTQKLSKQYNQQFYGAMKRFVNKHYNDSNVKKLLMNMVIAAAKLVAEIKAVFKNKNMESKKNSTYLAVGSKEQIAFVKKMFRLKNIDITSLEVNTTNVNINEILPFNCNAIIFCEGVLSNNSTVKLLEELPKSWAALFLQNGSNSIISSTNKNEVGYVMSIE